MKKLLLICTIIMAMLFQYKRAQAQELKDTYFQRFYYRSIISGTSSVGKYNLDLINGKNTTSLGFILDFPNTLINKVVKYENISQTVGFFFYNLYDDIANPVFNPDINMTVNATQMTAASISYGWNVYDIWGLNIYSGFNIYMGNKVLNPNDAATTQEDKFFIPAPYFFTNKSWNSNVSTNIDLMVSESYKELAKLAAKVVLNRKKFKLNFLSERNGSDYNVNYETSVGLTKKFGTDFFFRKFLGTFWPNLKNMTDAEVEEMDNVLNVPGYFNAKGGSSFNVNKLAQEKFSDKTGSSDNYFGKVEFGYIIGTGFSYKGDAGFGWKIGFNYGINLDAAGASSSSDSKMNKLMKGKNAFIQLEYYRNYINDEVFGMRIDPSMFRINLMIR